MLPEFVTCTSHTTDQENHSTSSRLLKSAYTNSGMQTQQGFPLVSGTDRQQPTNQVHTYAARWAYHGDGYAPVYYANAYMR